MKLQLTVKKKIILLIAAFALIVAVFSVAYLIFNNGKQQSANDTNIGGTGGDYTPPNTAIVTNTGVLYRSIGSANTTTILALISKAVIYDVSISNDANATFDYIQLNNFTSNTAKLYNSGKSYSVTIDDGKVHSINSTPWNYRYLLTVNDGRHFRLDTDFNPDNDIHLYSILKV